MSVLNGISGVVNGQHTIQKWSISSSADIQELFASNTLGGPIQLDGNEDWSGSFDAYGFQPVLVPGEFFTFRGSVDGTEGVKSEASGAIVDTVVISGDIEGGKPISYVVNFSGSGTLTKDSVSASDVTTPEPMSAIACTASLQDVVEAAAASNMSDVRTFTITLSAANTAYNSSTTGGQTLRLAGNFSAQVSLSLYESDFDNVVDPNASYILRITEANGTFWQFETIKFSEASGFEVDREGAALIGYTAGGAFSGFTALPASSFFNAVAATTHGTWVAGDAVQNATGSGDDWTGLIHAKPGTKTYTIQLITGTYADVNVSDQLENVTRSQTEASFTKALLTTYFIATLPVEHTTWEQSDVVRNATGAGDDWAGVIEGILTADTRFYVRLTSGTYADIDTADQMENTTAVQTEDFKKLTDTAIKYIEGTIIMPDEAILWP